jgi:asparagine synthase (glutamine-hydrolysing)
MCGIAGIWLRDGRKVKRSAIDRFSGSLAHRRPDGQGTWTGDDGHLALAHRRLAILDLSSAGDQPMTSFNQRYTITYNGEIYNFVELRSELESDGFRFRTETDTEVK